MLFYLINPGKNIKKYLNFEGKIEGGWLILQDWSQCTLACGGGRQYLQRMCIKEKNNNQPCSGPTILTKECNKQLCPDENEKNEKKRNLQLLMQTVRVSRGMPKYEACVIKQGSMAVLMEDSIALIKPRIPVTVILNNKTITIFSSNVSLFKNLNFIIRKIFFIV